MKSSAHAHLLTKYENRRVELLEVEKFGRMEAPGLKSRIMEGWKSIDGSIEGWKFVCNGRMGWPFSATILR